MVVGLPLYPDMKRPCRTLTSHKVPIRERQGQDGTKRTDEQTRRVLIVVPGPFPDGNAVGRATYMMAKGLEAHGQQVRVCARWGSAEGSLDVESKIVLATFGRFDQSYRTKMPYLSWLTSALGFGAYALFQVTVGDYDCIILYGVSPLFLPAAIVACLLGRRVAFVQYDLYRPSGLDGTWKHRLTWFYAFTERFLARSSRMMVLSESQLLIKRFGELAPKVPMFPNWPPTDADFFFAGDPTAGRRVCNVPAHIPLVMYVGTISRLEGVDLLIEAMREVVSAMPEATLVIAGREGGDVFPGRAPDYSSLPAVHGVAGSVRFLGVAGRNVVRDLLAAADCLVMAKREHEGNAAASPIKLGEYLTSGRPVVTTRVCGIEGWLTDGRDVVFCRPGDPADLAAALLRVLRDKAGAARIGQAGQVAGRRHCDFRQWGASFLQAWAASRSRSPGK